MLHADDAGLSPAINQAILELARQERLESISVIANSKFTEDFTKALGALLPKLNQPPQVFLHFNIVECRPLVNWPEASKRVGTDGNFYFGYSGVVKALLANNISPEVVRSELEAQCARLQELGLDVVGIDSHQHMHALAPIAETVQDFANKQGIKLIRSYDDMRTQTFKGLLNLTLFKLLAIVTEQRYYSHLTLPPSWHGHTWREFVMASWEPVRYNKLHKGHIIACHPGSSVDRGFMP